jgi:hypothetical protein
LPTNITLGWKGLPGTNVLAHYEHWPQERHCSSVAKREIPNEKTKSSRVRFPAKWVIKKLGKNGPIRSNSDLIMFH